MKIAIIVAMDKEMSLLLPMLENAAIEIRDDITYHTGNIGSHHVAVAKCGIGKVNAALSATSLINAFAPELVINSGVAGGTGAGASVLDVVAADRVAYHDTWCGPGTDPGDADGCPRFFTPPSPVIEAAALSDTIHGLICSGDRFISRAEEVEAIRNLYPDAVAVDMESAAIAHACHRRGVDFLSLRVISDTPGAADNISQYDNFWDKAPQSTFNTLIKLLEEIG